MPTGARQVTQVNETGRDVFPDSITLCALNVLEYSSLDSYVLWDRVETAAFQYHWLWSSGKVLLSKVQFFQRA